MGTAMNLSREINFAEDLFCSDAFALSAGGLTHASELAIEFGVAEHQSRRSAVRAVMGIIDQMTLFQQAEDFFLRQTLACFDGGFAGHHRDQGIQQIPP